MTHEEIMVRTAYAKFAYATQQFGVGLLANDSVTNAPAPAGKFRNMTTEQRLAATQVTLTLQDFTVGDVHEILSRKAVDLITPAAGEELATGGINHTFTDNGLSTHWVGLDARWEPAHMLPREVADWTIDDLYRVQWQKERPATLWQRYAAYTVTVTFDGKTRGPYKALFLFGHDEQGNEAVEPEDSTTSVTGLAFALHEKLFPDAFVRSQMRTAPVVRDWLDANQMTCSPGKDDVCCDLARLRCAPGRADVVDALAKPLPAETAGTKQQ
jgi:hypothetical protein